MDLGSISFDRSSGQPCAFQCRLNQTASRGLNFCHFYVVLLLSTDFFLLHSFSLIPSLFDGFNSCGLLPFFGLKTIDEKLAAWLMEYSDLSEFIFILLAFFLLKLCSILSDPFTFAMRKMKILNHIIQTNHSSFPSKLPND